MISLQALLPIDGVVATGVVRTAYPDLQNQVNTTQHLFTKKRLESKCNIEKYKSSNCASTFPELTSPRCESPNGPLVSGLTIMTLTPGRILKKNINGFSFTAQWTASGLWPANDQYLLFLTPWVKDSVVLPVQQALPWGAGITLNSLDHVTSLFWILRFPVYLSWRRDFMSTKTVEGSGPAVPWERKRNSTDNFHQVRPKICSTGTKKKLWWTNWKEDSVQVCMKVTCRQMARLTLEPKAVLTARGDRPRSLKSLEKDCVRERRGRSSAITTQLRTQDRFSPRA